VVTGVGSAEEALERFGSEAFDVVLLDLMLPGMSGFEVCREIRRSSDVPVVMLTARSDTHDVVAGLECGADDYVTKPFEVEEVQARLRAMLRRPVLVSAPTGSGDESRLEDGSRPSDVVVLDAVDGPLVFHRAGAQLVRGDRDIHLTMTEYRLLSVLTENIGRVLSRTALLEHVWERGFFGDERIVDVHVRRLRKKLELDPAEPRTLVTVRGLGYRLDAR
jgi:DNA-binding response OmpR family regulator